MSKNPIFAVENSSGFVKDKVVISLGKKRLELNPVVYTVVFTHDQHGMSFNVYDIQDSKKDHLAVAKDLIAAADSLQEDNQ